MKTIAPRFIETKNFSLTDKVEFRYGKIKNGFYLFPAVKLYYSENLVGFCIQIYFFNLIFGFILKIY